LKKRHHGDAEKSLKEVFMSVFFTADTHFGHGNIMKYCQRPGFSDREQELFDAYRKAADKGATRNELQALDFRVSRESVDRMDEYLLEGINSLVGESDTLYHLGDFCFGDKSQYYNVARAYRNRIKCRNVHIVWGNHDSFSIGDLFQSNHLMTTVREQGETIVCLHYAMAIWNKSHHGTWQLYGHSHSNAEAWMNKTMPGRRSLDVGVDNAVKLVGSYRPFSFEELKKMMDKQSGCCIDHHGDR
jgi:calcineurin-like phosphoesterase family protein